MTTLKPTPEPVHPVLNGDLPTVDLHGHSYDDHRNIVPALLDALAACGCWVLDQKALSPTQTELYFEVQLRCAFELYSGLLSAGVELTRDSHTRMNGLCTLRGHNPTHARRRRVVTIRLSLTFLDTQSAAPAHPEIGTA